MPNLNVAGATVPAPEHGEPVAARPALRLFAAARMAAGTGSASFPGSTVGEVLDGASAAFGPEFATVLAGSRLWLNGRPVDRREPVTDADELAVLPPVSGGA